MLRGEMLANLGISKKKNPPYQDGAWPSFNSDQMAWCMEEGMEKFQSAGGEAVSLFLGLKLDFFFVLHFL